MGKIVAIGGARMALDCLDEVGALTNRIVSMSRNENPKLVFLPTANFDSPDEVNDIEALFGSLGCSVSTLFLTDETLTHDEIEATILGADIIYVGGGNLKFLMDTWNKTGAVDCFRRAYDEGVVLSGTSSGAMCWFERGYDDCGPDGSFMFVDCVGLLPYCVAPHFNSENWHKFGQAVKEQDLSGIGIDNDAALICVDGKQQIIRAYEDRSAFLYSNDNDFEEMNLWRGPSEKLKIKVITDIHYYSKRNWIDCSPYENWNPHDQQLLRESEEIIKTAFDIICDDDSSDIVLIHGDITNNGELTSHEEIIELMRELKGRGKRVYVTTATHDYQESGKSYGFSKAGGVDVPAASREQLYDMYREFGIDEAIAVHKKSMSYVVELADGYRLLALNDDKGNTHAGYTDECFAWVEEQIADAKRNGCFVVAMEHHPILNPSPMYGIIGKHDILEDGLARASAFADSGVHMMFTGHSHIHNISYFQSENGSPFYDISTASLIGFPPTIRTVEIDGSTETVDIKTELVRELPGIDLEGLELTDYIKKCFTSMIFDMLIAAEKDTEKFADMAIAVSVPPQLVRKHKRLVHSVAKLINNLTFGKLGNLSRAETKLKKSDYADIKDEKVLPFIVDSVTNLFEGKTGYTPDTVKYKIAMGFVAVLDSIVKALPLNLKKLVGYDTISDIVRPLIYNCDIDSYNVTLNINKQYVSNTVKPYKSHKGIFIVILLVLAAIILAIPALVILGASKLISLFKRS